MWGGLIVWHCLKGWALLLLHHDFGTHMLGSYLLACNAHGYRLMVYFDTPTPPSGLNDALPKHQHPHGTATRTFRSAMSYAMAVGSVGAQSADDEWPPPG